MFGRKRKQDDFSAEIDAHLQLEIERLQEQGLTCQEARTVAHRAFGNRTKVQERFYESGRWLWWDHFWQDVRYAARVLRKSPGFTAVAVLTLALGIGANTAIFSVVNAVLLRPLPYLNPGQLALVPETSPKQGITDAGMSHPSLLELRDHSHVFSAIAGFASHSLTLTGRGEPSEARTIVVTQDFFSVFGTKPSLGRTLLPSDGQRGAAPVVVLSENMWRSQFGADPKIIGSTITLDMRPYSVVGVMPAEFRTPFFFDQADQLWIPLVQDPLFSGWMTRPPQAHWMPVIARLRPGMSFAQAQTEMDTMSARLTEEFPAEKGWRIQQLEPLQQSVVGDVKSPLLVLSCAVGLVLLIACANIANLLLTRATSRSKEISVRIALGAPKRRITRQLLTESALLGIFGGVAGMFLAYWGASALISVLPPGLPRIQAIRVDGWVLGFALVLSLAASLVFGLAPVLFAAQTDPQTNLREGARTGEARGLRRARSFLAIVEVALAMVLLVGAGLLLRSFARLTSVRPGFEPKGIVKAMVSLPQFQYSTQRQWTAFATELMTRLQADPGMQDSACAAPLPIKDGQINLPFEIAGNPPLPEGAANTADYVTASPRYFSVMGIPLLRGSWFNSSDSPSSPPVVLISDALARRYFANQNPLGKHLVFGFPLNGPASREIVGVVGDVRDVSLDTKPEPMMYVPFAQAPLYGCEVIVKSTLSASAVAAAIRTETHNIDKNVPVTDVATLPGALSESVASPRFRTLILSIFGAMALVLATVGIFGVVSYSVSRRTHEIGVRMTLGATPASVLRLVIGESARLVFFGVAVGIPVALALTRFLSTLLFDVRPADPLTFIGDAVLLTLVTLAASYVPARRAMRVDPMAALRYE
jgi:putative ABC transport system permease protein